MPKGRITSLPRAYNAGIIVWMRTTLNIDDDLLAEARKFTGEKEKTALVHLGLRALIEREAGKRLARLGATMPKLRVAPCR
jgi:Arc/MetJ family transcription regulator